VSTKREEDEAITLHSQAFWDKAGFGLRLTVKSVLRFDPGGVNTRQLGIKGRKLL